MSEMLIGGESSIGGFDLRFLLVCIWLSHSLIIVSDLSFVIGFLCQFSASSMFTTLQPLKVLAAVTPGATPPHCGFPPYNYSPKRLLRACDRCLSSGGGARYHCGLGGSHWRQPRDCPGFSGKRRTTAPRGSLLKTLHLL